MLRAWRFGDVFGAQSSVGVLFDYRGRELVLMVLVDHLLGGGIKDCWVSEGRPVKRTRDTVAAAMASNPEAFFEDIDDVTVARLLGSALTNAPCPEQADQIEDISKYPAILTLPGARMCPWLFSGRKDVDDSGQDHHENGE